MNEIWKDVPGYEGLYEISNLGNIRSLDRMSQGKRQFKIKGKKLKPWKDTRGYPQIYLCKSGNKKPIAIHRLVLISFVGLHPEKNTVNHKNGVLDDNRLDNLEWTTQKENNNHAFNTGLMDSILGENGTKFGLTNKQAKEIRRLSKTGMSNKEIADKYKVPTNHIYNIVKRKSFKRV